jgi:hypothetical protein
MDNNKKLNKYITKGTKVEINKFDVYKKATGVQNNNTTVKIFDDSEDFVYKPIINKIEGKIFSLTFR